MDNGNFLDRKRASPVGFALVVAGHAAALSALVMIKGPEIIPSPFRPTLIHNVLPTPPAEPPPPEPEPVRKMEQLPQQPTRIDRIEPIIDPIVRGPVVTADPLPPLRPRTLPPGTGTTATPLPDPVVEPVRIEARIDPKYAHALQPPYPASEQRAQREGEVRIRVTIGADGRVKAVERLSATTDAFWSTAERHARARWRFQPATVDGRPVESQKVMTLQFRLED